MKKYIHGKLYNTDTSSLLASREYGEKASAAWYVESLFRKRSGELFLYGEGGDASPYGSARIVPLTWDDARQWAESRLPEEEYAAIFEPEDAVGAKERLLLSLSSSAAGFARRGAAIEGKSLSAYIEGLITHQQVKESEEREMKKLEKSIRHAMTDYGAKLRAGGYWSLPGHGSGIVRQGHRTFRDAYCDVDDGIVTCIRMYGCGDAWDRRDHDGETCEITESIVGYLDGDLDYSWDALIESIADTVEKYTAEE